jgi:hypothetical protein
MTDPSGSGVKYAEDVWIVKEGGISSVNALNISAEGVSAVAMTGQ